MSATTSTSPPTFSAPVVSTAQVNSQTAEAEERVIAKLRALLRDGRGSMMITVQPGQVQFWKVLPDGRSEIG